MLTLYYAKGSSALASHILLEEVGATYAVHEVPIQKGAHKEASFLAINPKMRVPALQTPEGVITENPAILNYVAATHPEAGMLPDTAFERAQVDALNAYLCATMHMWRSPTYYELRDGLTTKTRCKPWRPKCRQTSPIVRLCWKSITLPRHGPWEKRIPHVMPTWRLCPNGCPKAGWTLRTIPSSRRIETRPCAVPPPKLSWRCTGFKTSSGQCWRRPPRHFDIHAGGFVGRNRRADGVSQVG